MPRALPTRGDLVNKIFPPAGHFGIVTGEINSRATRAQLQPQAIVKAHGLIDRLNFVVAVGSAAEDAETQVDFCEGVELQGVLQRFAPRTALGDAEKAVPNSRSAAL